jgi:hypothetical protein
VFIDRNEHLCEEASSAQHGWFHFGSLYSIFPQNQFLRTMVGGVEDLLKYYAGLKGMNIAVTGTGRLAFSQSESSWFRDEPIEYIVCARNDPDFAMRSFDGISEYAHKVFFLLTWEMAVKQFISRHQRFHKHDWSGSIPASQWIPRAGFSDYSREVITKPDHCDVDLDRDTHFRIIGYDRPMRATVIMRDLVSSLLGAGGEVRTSTEVERLEKSAGKTVYVHTTAGALTARTIILAAGKWLGRFFPCASDVRVVASQLVVESPAVSDRKFFTFKTFV